METALNLILTECRQFPSLQAGLDRCVKSCQVRGKLIGSKKKCELAIVRYVLGNLIVMCLFRITSAGCL